MRFSDIKVGHIYNVIFDPVHNCEFCGKHLAVVLKRNNDRATFIVMPLTSAPNGEGINIVNIGCVSNLPSSLKTNNTYAVYNQIRTVNADRFISLKEGNTVKECEMDESIFHNLLLCALREIVYSTAQDDRIKILKKAYEIVSKAKDIAYQVIKLRAEENPDKKRIDELLIQIKSILQDVSYSLDEKLVEDGIGLVFEEAKII